MPIRRLFIRLMAGDRKNPSLLLQADLSVFRAFCLR